MIQVPTVLVLGAGASSPYGFPSGAELRQIIISHLKPEAPWHPLLTVLRSGSFSFSGEDINNFRTELIHANAMSVDLFLERRPKFTDIGKAAIAAALLPFEADSIKTMFEPWACHLRSQQRAREGWYQYFASQLKLGYNDWGKGLLTIVTYNYDRSLEHYLFTILRSSCDQSLEECLKKFREIPIIHLHGELGRYDPLDSNALSYGVSLDATNALRAAVEIKIIHEVQPGGQFDIAQNALDDAHMVCFLGCGYAPENMARLNWNRRKDTSHPKHILGTTYELTPAEKRRLKLDQYLTTQVASYWTVLRFLKETDVLG